MNKRDSVKSGQAIQQSIIGIPKGSFTESVDL